MQSRVANRLNKAGAHPDLATLTKEARDQEFEILTGCVRPTREAALKVTKMFFLPQVSMPGDILEWDAAMPAVIHWGQITFPGCGYMLMSKDMLQDVFVKLFQTGRDLSRLSVFTPPPEALILRIRIGTIFKTPPKGKGHSRKVKKQIRKGKKPDENPPDHVNTKCRAIDQPVFARLERSWMKLAFQWVDDDGRQIGEDVFRVFNDYMERMRYLITLVDGRTYRMVCEHNENVILDCAHALIFKYRKEAKGLSLTADELRAMPDCSDWRKMGLVQPLYTTKIARFFAHGYTATAKEMAPAAQLEREIKEYSAVEKSKAMLEELRKASTFA